MKKNFAYITKLLAIKTIIKKILNIDCDERASLVGRHFVFLFSATYHHPRLVLIFNFDTDGDRHTVAPQQYTRTVSQ